MSVIMISGAWYVRFWPKADILQIPSAAAADTMFAFGQKPTLAIGSVRHLALSLTSAKQGAEQPGTLRITHAQERGVGVGLHIST